MDKNIILKELARKLPETEGISYELQNDKLKVKVGEDNEFEVRPSGGITCYPETVYDDKFHEAEILISNTVREIKEYVDIMQTAPELKAEGIGEGFKKIIDFNNTVLAGRYLNDNDGFQFVTWMYDRTGVCAGHYYNDDFEKAKESFAKRSGFINPNKLFSDEELSEIYRCISDTLYGGFDLDDEQRDILEDIQEKIKDGVDNLFELIDQAQNQEMEQLM